MPTETSLVLCKPDAVAKRLIGTVLARFEAAGLKVSGIKMLQLDETLLLEHYAHVAHMPFFPDIVSFMSSTPVVAVAVSGENAVDAIRALLGPTDSRVAPPGTIRGDFGEDVMINVCHASDSLESAAVELRRFFSDGELFAF